MARPTPERVDPWLLAEQEAVLEGRIALAELPRVAPLLREPGGEVRYHLRFVRDDRGRPLIDGSVQAELRLECQRCLEAMSHEVDAHVLLAVVSGLLEAERLPAEQDPLLLQEKEPLAVRELVEEELLLSIPVSPRHAAHRCDGPAAVPEDPQAGGTDEERPNPFAVLAGLKSGGNQS